MTLVITRRSVKFLSSYSRLNRLCIAHKAGVSKLSTIHTILQHYVYLAQVYIMRRRMMFQSMTDCIYNNGPIRLYYNTIVLELPTVFSTVTCCTGL